MSHTLWCSLGLLFEIKTKSTLLSHKIDKCYEDLEISCGRTKVSSFPSKRQIWSVKVKTFPKVKVKFSHSVDFLGIPVFQENHSVSHNFRQSIIVSKSIMNVFSIVKNSEAIDQFDCSNHYFQPSFTVILHYQDGADIADLLLAFTLFFSRYSNKPN